MTIENYINHIRTIERSNADQNGIETIYMFHGDGTGNYEQREKEATQEAVTKYLKDLESQKRLAKDYLLEKYGVIVRD